MTTYALRARFRSDLSTRYHVAGIKDNGHFFLGTLDEARKFDSIPQLLKFVSRRSGLRGRANDDECGTYDIVEVEQRAWREIRTIQ
jgi:hypothetical protein